MRCGSRNIWRHTEHSLGSKSGGEVTNSQGYPPSSFGGALKDRETGVSIGESVLHFPFAIDAID